MKPLAVMDELLPVLLRDAERLGVAGRVREALVLLRWASRIASRAEVPLVLLCYRRIRQSGSDESGGELPGVDPGEGFAADFGGVGGEPDELGFPVPRFPTQAPTLDATAFVEPPRREALEAIYANATDANPARAGQRLGGAWLLLLAGCVVAVVLLAMSRISGLSEVLAVPGEGALDQARALLRRGDCHGGEVAARQVLREKEAGALEAADLARLVARCPDGEELAADLFLDAFSAGLPRDHWPAVAEALERAGRQEQAVWVRALLQNSRSEIIRENVCESVLGDGSTFPFHCTTAAHWCPGSMRHIFYIGALRSIRIPTCVRARYERCS